MKFDFSQQPGLIRWNRNLKFDGKPLVSIITAFYNAGKYFQQTYNSVMDQTFPWFEWIIVDDGSTDEESLLLLNKLALSDQRIKIIHQENAGAPSARNTGILNSTTDYIFPLDSDDLIEPTCLEYNFWALYFNPKATWSYSDSVGFQNEEYLWDASFDPERMKKTNHLVVTALIRKQAALDVGCYSIQEGPFDEDWHFWLKLLAQGAFPVQIKGEYLFWYRRSENGVYASVHNNLQNNKRNKKIISEQAAFVIAPEKPVIYPTGVSKTYTLPVESKWNRSIYKEHHKIHILCLFPWLSMGGADKFNLDLLTGLDKECYEISIITTTPSDNAWLQRFREVTPEIFNLPNFLSDENFPEFINYFIKSREIDIIFQSNSLDGYYLLPWIRQHFPNVAIVDYVHMEEWYWRNGGYARDSGIMGNIIEHTYVCNSATRKIMVEKLNKDPEKVETVHIGIDDTYFNPDKVRPSLLYKELKIATDRPIVLFICRLHPQKRPFLMLKIAEQVKKEIENIAFVVIGDGPQEEELQAAAESMNLTETVYFLGAKSEVRPYYRDAKLTLICSMKEGLALTAYESCAMGVPVISADVGGQKDLIDNEVGALIPYMQDEEQDFDVRTFSKAEIAAYTNAIVEVLSDDNKWNILSQKCRCRIKKSFTINTMIEKMDAEFRRIVATPSLALDREKKTEALKELGLLAGELYTVSAALKSANPFATNTHFEGKINNSAIINRLSECEKVLARHEEVVNRHEEVVNRHEEVVNRHEEVVNRHEKSINHQWEVQKWHEERIQVLEHKNSLWKKITHKFL